MNDTITLSLDSIIDKEKPDISEHIKTVGISFLRKNGKYLMNFNYSKFMQAISAKSGRKQLIITVNNPKFNKEREEKINTLKDPENLKKYADEAKRREDQRL